MKSQQCFKEFILKAEINCEFWSGIFVRRYSGCYTSVPPHLQALHQQIFNPDTSADNAGHIGTRFRSCRMVSPASFKRGLKKLFSEGLDKHLGEKLRLASLLNRFSVVQ